MRNGSSNRLIAMMGEQFDPLAVDYQVAQNQALQQRNKLADLALRKEEQAAQFDGQRRNALMGSMNRETGAIDGAAYTKALAGIGDYEGLQSFQANQAAQAKAQRDAEKAELESKLKRFEISAQIMGPVKDQATWQMARQQAAEIFGPEVAMQMPEEYNPVLVEQKRAQALSLKDQLEQKWKQKGYDLDVAKFGYQQKNDEANRSVTIRGQNLTDARGREFNALKAQENQINQQGIVGKKVQEVELKLQDDYRNESKGFGETATAMKKVLGSIDVADKNPGSALAAGTAFMKLLDPNSVVRESELGMALNASGWFDRAMNIANTLQAGKVMTPKQKENLKKASETLFEEAKAAQREIDAAYEQRAKAYGADPSRVIVDRGQKVSGKPAPAGGGLTQEEMQELAELRKALGRK